MSTRTRFLAPDSNQLKTLSELKQWASEKDRPSTQPRLAYVIVYSHGTQIFKSGPFYLILSVLGDLLDRISALFEPTSRMLHFKLVSWRIENQLPIVSTTTFGSQLLFHVKHDRVMVTLRVGGFEKIIRSINSSVSFIRRKTSKAPSSRFTRSKGLRANPETKTITYTQTQCIPSGCTTSTFTKKVYNRTYTSVRTSGYMSLKKKGQLPPQPYSMVTVDVEPGYFSSSKVWTGQPHFVDLQITASPNLLDTDIASGHLGVDENLLIAKLAGKISSRANLAETLATGNQTVRLVRVSVTRFATFVQLINGGSPAAIRKFLGNAKGSSAFVHGVSRLRKAGLSGSNLLAQLWLEYRYGWLPLISDVSASMAVLKSYGLKNPGILSVSASRRTTANKKTSVVYATNPDASPRTRFYYEIQQTTCRIGIRYRLDNKLVQTLSGLGLTSPVSLAWELVPFSFVVDWFLPIGPALQAFSAFEGLVFMSGYKTYFTKVQKTLTVKESYTHTDVNPLNSYKLKESGGCFGKRVTMNRTVLTNFPGPKVPMPKSPFSFIHAANAAALAVKILTRK